MRPLGDPPSTLGHCDDVSGTFGALRHVFKSISVFKNKAGILQYLWRLWSISTVMLKVGWAILKASWACWNWRFQNWRDLQLQQAQLAFRMAHPTFNTTVEINHIRHSSSINVRCALTRISPLEVWTHTVWVARHLHHFPKTHMFSIIKVCKSKKPREIWT